MNEFFSETDEEDESETGEYQPSTAKESGEHVFIVTAPQEGQRLDVFLASRITDLSRSQIQRIVGTGSVQVNGAVAKPSYKVSTGDLILLDVPPLRPTEAKPENIPLDIVYEDADVIVLNKQKGLVVHPAPGAETGTLVNALLYHCDDLSGIGGEERPGIVHRIDKDTTGLMMVAKNDVSHNHLQAQYQRRTATRKYMALIWGRPNFQEAIIDAAIGRHPTDRKKMTVVEPGSTIAGRPALTHVFVRENLGPITLIECMLQTGRTHQIRVHLSYIGHPVVADALYGGQRRVGSDVRGSELINEYIAGMNGQALHAYSLSFQHPRTEERMTFTLPLPPEMEALVELLHKSAI